MTKLMSGGFFVFLMICPAHAVFILREPEARDIWRDFGYIQTVQGLSADEPDRQPVILKSSAGSGFTRRLAGDLLGDDFLLQPVSLMNLDCSTDRRLTAESSNFDLECYCPAISSVKPERTDSEQIAVSKTPAPSAVLLALAAVVVVGLLRHRLVKY